MGNMRQKYIILQSLMLKNFIDIFLMRKEAMINLQKFRKIF